ncbi:RcpC/CpaB family pilus assembly protein [Sinomonas sp. JGH33]|uniref:RcpC/CpaB family pilus assembly protein n=1 Tax=Sinomonas terricola TaxID=3110330 RepID=A0ABU5T1G8_9MICC|nr:RcpC/CpaB family pilus assembly protein [Sinomonas sp. JGH33]MEA5453425.1 RcpC/CpaB family pilus assembly protein [Sinomonas sp. JGH33]
MRTRLLGGVAALIVAVIGTVLLLTYVNGADRRAFANVETEDVYVVQKTIPAGTAAASLGDSVAKKTLPKAAIAANAVTDLAAVQGKVASVDLQPGEDLLTSRFVDPTAAATSGRANVPAGMQEVTIKLPIERVVGGALAPGDTVGILISFGADNGQPAQTQLTYNKVLLTAVQLSSGANARDTSTTQTAASGGSGIGSASSNSGGDYLVTFALAAADAQRIVYAVEFGKVYLTKEPANAQLNASGTMDRTRVFQ